MIRVIAAEPLTAAAFAPFGDVADRPTAGSPVLVGPAVNLRATAAARLRWVNACPAAMPLRVATMERHVHSSQSFIPSGETRWLVLVAPHAGEGGAPDMTRARAFVAAADQAVTYRPNVWHHPLTTLDGPANFAVLTYLDGGPADEEFVPVTECAVDMPGC